MQCNRHRRRRQHTAPRRGCPLRSTTAPRLQRCHSSGKPRCMLAARYAAVAMPCPTLAQLPRSCLPDLLHHLLLFSSHHPRSTRCRLCIVAAASRGMEPLAHVCSAWVQAAYASAASMQSGDADQDDDNGDMCLVCWYCILRCLLCMSAGGRSKCGERSTERRRRPG